MDDPVRYRYHKGTEIICPKCGSGCGTANRDILMSEWQMSSEPWDGVNPSSTMVCECGTPYWRNVGGRIELHVLGWK